MDRQFYATDLEPKEDDLEALQDNIEAAQKNLLNDRLGAGIVTGLGVSENGPPDLQAFVAAGVGYTQDAPSADLGQRVEVTGSTLVDCSVDENSASTAVSSGNERYISIVIRFLRLEATPRQDPYMASQINFDRLESITLAVKAGAEAATGTAAKPSIDTTELCLCDILITNGKTQIVNADIDTTRRVVADTMSDKQDLSEKGQASGYASLDSGGKVPSSELPALSLTNIYTVSDEASQLALGAVEGDVAVRTDLNKSYVHNGGSAATMADWTELLTPTDAVLSVAGKTGAVTLVQGDISGLVSALAAKQETSEKGQVNGYASLDGSGDVPDAQIPQLAESKITNLTTDLAGKQATSQKGQANGYASLGADSIVPDANLPARGWELISSQTAATDTEIVFSSGIDSTYDLYMFVLTNIISSINGGVLYCQISENGGASYLTSGYKYHFNQSSSYTTTYSGMANDAGINFKVLPVLYNNPGIQEGRLIMFTPSSSREKIFSPP